MKFKYENKLIPKPEIKFETGIEALINDNLYSIDMSEMFSDIKYNLFDSTFSIFGTEADENKSDQNDPWYKKMWKFIKDLFLKIVGYIKAGFKWIKSKLFKSKDNKVNSIEEVKEVIDVVKKLIANNEELNAKRDTNTNQYIQELADICYSELKKNKKISENKTDAELNTLTKTITKGVINGSLKAIAIDTWILNDDISDRIRNTHNINRFMHNRDTAGSLVDEIGTGVLVTQDIKDMSDIIMSCIYLLFGEDRHINDYYNENVRDISHHRDSAGSGEKLLKYTDMISKKVLEVSNYNGDADLLVKYTTSIPLEGDYSSALDEFERTIEPTADLIDTLISFLSNQERNLKMVENSIDTNSGWNPPQNMENREEELRNYKENMDNFKKCLSNLTTASNNLIKIFGSTFVERGKDSARALSTRWNFINTVSANKIDI